MGQGKDATQKIIKLAIEALLNRQDGENANVQGEFGGLGVVTFGIDEHGLWMEKAKDAGDPKDTDAAAGTTTGTGTGATGDGDDGNKNTEGTTDASSGNPTNNAAKDGPESGSDGDGSVHRKEERVLDEFEIEIREGDDAKGLVDILRAAGYDVEFAEPGEDGKYTVQEGYDDEGNDAETDDGGKRGKKTRHTADEL